jgi:hypothetical protein
MTSEEWRADCWRRFQEAVKAATTGGNFEAGNRLLRGVRAKHGATQADIARRELINYVERGKT